MIYWLCIAGSLVTLTFLAMMTSVLCIDAIPGIWNLQLFQSGYWDFRSHSFSALAMIFGTLVVAGTAIGLAAPVGLAAALFTSERLTGKSRAVFKILIELLAGVPSVVYGLLGVAFLVPWMAPTLMHLGGISGDSLITAGVLLAVMILPTVITFTDDALRCVPKSTRHQGLGLGLSRAQVALFLVVPHARAGIISALMLALGRAIGETIAIYMVVGRTDQLFAINSLSLQSLLEAGQTLTTKLGGAEIAIAYGDKPHWQALMGLGLILWITIGMLSLSSHRLMRWRA